MRRKKAKLVIAIAVIFMIAVLVLFSIVRTQRSDRMTVLPNLTDRNNMTTQCPIRRGTDYGALAQSLSLIT